MSDGYEKHVMVAFGGNLPFGEYAAADTLHAAVAALPAEGFSVVRLSRFFATPCFPAGAGPDYVNAAALLRCDAIASPAEALAALHRIESVFGRERQARWAGRTLDLDLLAWGGQVLPDRETQVLWQSLPPEDQARRAPDRLILPHPRMQDRAFVLVPLADVAPDWRHPILGKTVSEMLDALPKADKDAVIPL